MSLTACIRSVSSTSPGWHGVTGFRVRLIRRSEPARTVAVYLDISWDEVGLVVEIDGGHHGLALNPVDDALRQNERVAVGERVLRIPVIGLRVATDKFMQQVRRTYVFLSRP